MTVHDTDKRARTDKLFTDMSRWGSPDGGSGRGRVATAQPDIWRNAGWALLQALALVALGYAGWRLVGSTAYRIDIEV
jgi:alpha-1,2-mannosyltransferase